MFHEAGRTPYSKQLQTLVRYDLLCLEGLARALRVFTGSEAIPVYRLASILCGSMLQMHVKPQEWSMEAGICCCGGGDDSSGGWRRRGPGSRDGAASLVQATWRAACVGVGVLHEAADDVPRHPLLAHLQLSSPTRLPPSSSSRGRRRGRQSRAPDCTAPQSRL